MERMNIGDAKSHGNRFHPDGLRIDKERTGRKRDPIWNAAFPVVQAGCPILVEQAVRQWIPAQLNN